MSKHTILKIAVPVIVVLLLTGGVFVFAQKRGVGLSKGDSAEQEEVKPLFYSMNGSVVSEEVSKRRPIAVMVENHPDARPQSGLSQADIVYEVLAEGGITRYMALFQSADVEAIGPVRSAREYFAELASEWGAVYAHVGGSPKALEKLKLKQYIGVTDLDEYFNEHAFERIKIRSAPHNVYTSTERLRSYVTDHAIDTTAHLQSYQFTDGASIHPATASIIDIGFSLPSFKTQFAYDAATNSYKRSLAGKADVDKLTSEHVTVKNIIVQYVTVTDVPNDPKLRVDIDLDGSGKAIVFQDGIAHEGTWKKSGGITRYYDSAGNEIALNRGKIWISLVPSTNTVVYK